MIDSASTAGGAPADLKKARRERSPAPSPDTMRSPPNDQLAERGVLGCVLLSPNDCVGEMVMKLGGNIKTVMYDLRHQTILDELVEMFEARLEIDVITLQCRLKNKQLLEQIGGIQYLMVLPDTVPSAANLSHYLDIIEDKRLLRAMITTCTDIVGQIYEYEGEVPALMDEVERDILALRQSETRAMQTAKELARRSISYIEECHQRQGQSGGIPTGFADLDKLTDGMHPGDMIVVSGFEKSGKTSLTMNIVENVCLQQKLPVGVFSLEMTADSLMTRLICSNARVNLRTIQDGFMAERDFPKLTTSACKLGAAALHIDDSCDLTIMQLRAKSRRMAQQHGIKLLVVDYLQLVLPEKTRNSNREQDVSGISKGIKAMAKELGIPVLVLSQQNEAGALRESRAIGQDADGVWKLIKPKAKRDDNENDDSDSWPMILRVDRQRNGGTGNVNLNFFRSITRFELASPLSDEDIPTTSNPPYPKD